jgi:hypothetical protein
LFDAEPARRTKTVGANSRGIVGRFLTLRPRKANRLNKAIQPSSRLKVVAGARNHRDFTPLAVAI